MGSRSIPISNQHRLSIHRAVTSMDHLVKEIDEALFLVRDSRARELLDYAAKMCAYHAEQLRKTIDED